MDTSSGGSLSASPLEYSETASQRLGIHLWLKRDDLLPYPAAGNKFRKGLAILDHRPRGVRDIVSVGSSGSNHLRTMAALCAKIGVRFHAVCHETGSLGNHPNQELGALHGARYYCVPAPEIADAVERIVKNHDAWFIPGGGHHPAGAAAYRDAGVELREQFECIESKPDFVVVPSGTGATQGGLIVGLRNWSRVIGISVGRLEARGSEAVREAANWLEETAVSEIMFHDGFLAGGYGRTNVEIDSVIRWAGLVGMAPLDRTYTGKAFWGLTAMVDEGIIPQNARVVFWHTGGLLNLTAHVPPGVPA